MANTQRGSSSGPRTYGSGRAGSGSGTRRPGAGPVRGGKRPAAKRGSRISPGLIAIVSVAVVIIVVGALVAVMEVGGGGGKSTTASAANAASPDIVHAVTQVPPATLAKVGAGSAAAVGPPKAVKTSPLPALLTKNGKPEILYIGAEYCPYCAAERWPMIVALSRFGTFSNLGTTTSSSSDVYPSTQTFTFYGSHYTSKYVSFTPVETQTNHKGANGQYTPLQTPTAAQAKLLAKYDVPPYTQSSNGIPFVDFANRYIVVGASYSPQILQGLARGTIAGSLSDPSSAPAKSIDATANYLTASICETTHGQPGKVCNASGVKAAAAKLGK
ncbi:MAG: DUF929 family protein [Acidimicrobiales bacterium]